MMSENTAILICSRTPFRLPEKKDKQNVIYEQLLNL